MVETEIWISGEAIMSRVSAMSHELFMKFGGTYFEHLDLYNRLDTRADREVLELLDQELLNLGEISP